MKKSSVLFVSDTCMFVY